MDPEAGPAQALGGLHRWGGRAFRRGPRGQAFGGGAVVVDLHLAIDVVPLGDEGRRMAEDLFGGLGVVDVVDVVDRGRDGSSEGLGSHVLQLGDVLVRLKPAELPESALDVPRVVPGAVSGDEHSIQVIRLLGELAPT